MKTITEQEALHQFEEFSKRAHDGEKTLVTREGEPWVVLVPPPATRRLSEEKPTEWPNFEAHWNEHFPEAISGPTATELLAADKEDRF